MMSRKPVFHISGAREWRGGEIQLALLARNLPPVAGDRCFVPRGSELAKRLSGIAVEQLSGTGFLHPLAAFQIRRRLGGAILHAHSSKAIETALLAKAGRGAPLVISRKTAFPVSSGWKYRAAEAIIAVSQAAMGQLVAAGVEAGRITVIPDAVDADRFADAVPDRLGGEASEALVLCAAAFTAEKDHRTLLRAWARVEQAGANARLVLAGDGPLRAELQSLAGELGLRRVQFAGWRDDMPALVAGCDIAVLTSTSEGLSGFMLETQWCGKPAVATDAGGLPEAVLDGETGLLSPAGEAERLAASLLSLISDRDLRGRMGAAAGERARRLFAPARISGMTEAVYASL